MVDLVPELWLERAPALEGPDEVRTAYVDHLLARASNPQAWLPQVVS